MELYDHQNIEKKWQEKWAKSGLFDTPDKAKNKKNFYTLIELPYPSGNLHVGHWYAFSIPDIYNRFLRASGKNVLYPIGFDSFGLPAENAAIKHEKNPREWTEKNIETMKKQLQSMGASFDWSREISAHTPEYYQWNQWLFTKFFEKGWIYKSVGKVNWCESCKTVLANEQVLPDKTCERCGKNVLEKEMPEWKFRILDFADRLLDSLDQLDWPEYIKDQQRNWIGRSEGVEIEFQVTSRKSQDHTSIKVFTTHPDTLFGATFTVLAPEHSLVMKMKDQIENWDEVSAYILTTSKKDEIERTNADRKKTGVQLQGVSAVNPANGEKIPIFIADYVLTEYGTGAIMAVPAHDERDFEFAKKYDLPIREVISGKKGLPITGHETLKNSDKFDGMDSDEAKQKIAEFVGGVMTKTYKLRDWSVSRQRYWGCPIPIVYDPGGNPHIVPKEYLPWKLPEDVDFAPDGTAPLARSSELQKRTEHIFGKGWTPDVETLDTFVDSSWYFYRYLDPKNNQQIFDAEKIKTWAPVDMYFGGAEHTTMHLLYSRFYTKMLYDLGLIDHEEPYNRRINRGLILGPDGNKMSKSKGNVIDPDAQVKKFGADTVRLYLAFLGPYTNANYPWNDNAIVGVRRFLDRVWRVGRVVSDSSTPEIEKTLHKMIKKVSEDIQIFKFNTAISQMMVFINTCEKPAESVGKKDFESFLVLLSFFAPHISEELWEYLGNTGLVASSPLPMFDAEKIKDDTITYAIQVNGKLRGELSIEKSTEKNAVLEAAKTVENVQRHLEGKKIIKEIFVPEKIVGFVVSDL